MSPRGGEAAGVFISGELLVFDDSFEHEAGAPVETRPLPRVSTAPGLPARRLSHVSGFSSHPRWGLHHQVWNRSASEVRVVLLIRFWHPDIAPARYPEAVHHMRALYTKHRRRLMIPPLRKYDPKKP